MVRYQQSLMSKGTANSPFSQLALRLLGKHSARPCGHIPLTQMLHPVPMSPAKGQTQCMLIARGCGHPRGYGIPLFRWISTEFTWKGGDIMLKINFMSTLFVGIDVSSKSNVVYAMDFHKNNYLQSSFRNNRPGTQDLCRQIHDCLRAHKELHTLVFAMESTSVYSIHLANYLSTCEELLAWKPYVFCLNPKVTKNYSKAFIGRTKTDPQDAFVLSDFARAGLIESEPWRGSQFLALKRLTRHRLHLTECITREKTYMVSNLYLKFSELQLLEAEEKPWSNLYGATSSAVLTEYLSPQEIVDATEEELLAFLAAKSKNRISDLSKTTQLLRKAARDSYRLDQCLYEPINISLASSFHCIETFKKEIQAIDKAIEKTIRGMNPNAFTILQSIDGIGPVFASGILAEIGDIHSFHSSDALAKYAGLTWSQNQSGDFRGEDTSMLKAGNAYLRYYLGEAANSVRKYLPQYRDYYAKKYNEVPKHQHKRALALTSRKFVRLVFGLLAKNQLYTGEKLDPQLNHDAN